MKSKIRITLWICIILIVLTSIPLIYGTDEFMNYIDEMRLIQKGVSIEYISQLREIPQPYNNIILKHILRTGKLISLDNPFVSEEIGEIFNKIDNEIEKKELGKDYGIKEDKLRVVLELKDSEFNQYTHQLIPKGIERKTSYEDIIAVYVSEEELEVLQDNLLIEKITPDLKLYPSTSESFPLINHDLVIDLQVNGVNIDGYGQSVCVIDTGIDKTHQSLSNKVVYEDDFNGDGIAEDTNGHGTSMAGLIAGNGSYKGIAHGANLVVMRASDGGLDGETFDTYVGNAVNNCVNNRTLYNITIIYIGFASSNPYNDDPLDGCDENGVTTIKTTTAKNNKNITVFAPAGNGEKTNGISYPACSSDIISVGSVDDGGGGEGEVDKFSNFSNRHNILELLAPGELVSVINESTIINSSGTSISTAIAVGSAVLLRQYNELAYNKSLTPLEIKTIFELTGKQITVPSIGTKPRIDLLSAIHYETFPPNITLITQNNSIQFSPVKLDFNVTDHHNLNNCSLVIDGVVNSTINDLVRGNYSFTASLDPNTYSWQISCYDNSTIPNLGSSETITLNVIQNPPPLWNPIPSNQTVEFGGSFSYVVNADDVDNVTYSIDDNSNFGIDSVSGEIKNNTFLSVGGYNININATDTINQTNTSSIYIFVKDTTSPVWISPQSDTNYTIELGEVFSLIVNATDLTLPLSYSIDNPNFIIDALTNSSGEIKNNSLLTIEDYIINITVSDIYNNTNSTIVNVIVQDTTPPVWTNFIDNGVYEFGSSVSLNVSAFDLSNSITYSINDTLNFNINTLSGEIKNNTFLSVGEYNVLVSAIDNSNNSISNLTKITISDTTSPVWVISPTSKTISENEELVINISADDLSNLTYTISDNVNFKIELDNGQYFITNNTIISEGVYFMIVTVMDIYNNSLLSNISVNVNDGTSPVWNPLPSDQTIELGESFSYNVNADDNGIVTYSINDNVNFSIDSVNGEIKNNTFLEKGVYNLIITAKDQQSNSVSTSINITIVDTTPPIWIISPKDKQFSHNEDVMFSVSAFDLSEIIYSLEDINGGFSISQNGEITNSTKLSPNNYSIDIIAYDNSGNNISNEITITIINSPPVFLSNPPTIAQEEFLYTYKIEVDDSDDGKDNLDIDLISYPNGMTIDNNENIIEWLPNYSHIGEHLINISVSDSFSTIYQDFVIKVEDSKKVEIQNLTLLTNPSTPENDTLFYFEIINTGKGNVSNIGWSVDYGEGIITQSENVTLSPNGKVSVITKARFITPGVHTINVNPEYDNTIQSIITQGQILQLNVTGFPDLEISEFSILSPLKPKVNEVILVYFVIKNIGDGNVKDIEWTLDYGEGDKTQFERLDLDSEEEAFIIESIVLNQLGDHTINAIVDPNNLIDYENKLNNMKSVVVDVG